MSQTWNYIKLGFGALLVISMVRCIGDQNDAKRRTEAVEAAKSPEQRALDVAMRAKSDAEINIVLAGARQIKDSMKKPETFVLTHASMIDGKVICYQYTARNSWNDVTHGHYVVSNTVSTDRVKEWNALCAGKRGADYTSVRAVM